MQMDFGEVEALLKDYRESLIKHEQNLSYSIKEKNVMVIELN